MSSESDIRALAKRFFDAVEAGDIDTLYDCYAPQAEIWHNTDEAVQSRDDNAATLKGFVARISNRVYANRRLEVFPGGFVQQHELRGVRSDGVAVRLTDAAQHVVIETIVTPESSRLAMCSLVG